MDPKKLTKYEFVRILGARALQISMSAPILLKLNEKELKELDYDSLRIAEAEITSGVLPISVKRPLPGKIEEKKKVLKKALEEVFEEEKEEVEESEEEFQESIGEV